MLHLVILLLTSGCVALCLHINREYYLINEMKKWDEAQSECREQYTDLATIGNHDNMKRLVTMTAASGVTAEIWIGLKKTGAASWLWSVGETQTSNGLVEYTNWASLPDSSHYCGGVLGDGKWLSAFCVTKARFVCQEVHSDEGSRGMRVVLEEKTWREAQEYCRQTNKDLASVRSQAENQALERILNENGVTFAWIGLFRDEWKWSDQSDSSFRYWDDSQPNRDGVCVLYNPGAKRWFDRSCNSSHPFYCYNVKVTQQIVRVEMKSNSFLNFSDPATSEAILKQLQKKYEVARLQWSVQPDGKIFHKKKKINETCKLKGEFC